MKYYDITKELFTSSVYPGDPIPEYERLSDMEKGDICNLTYLKMCVHNGTHMDAPRHFIKNGRTIEQLSLEHVMGQCTVAEYEGTIDGRAAASLLNGCKRKVLLKGNILITEEAAREIACMDIELLGVEGQSVGTDTATARIHEILLGKGMVLLEGLVLNEVKGGEYFLCAQPIKLGGCEGAPCRAVLLEM